MGTGNMPMLGDRHAGVGGAVGARSTARQHPRHFAVRLRFLARRSRSMGAGIGAHNDLCSWRVRSTGGCVVTVAQPLPDDGLTAI